MSARFHLLLLQRTNDALRAENGVLVVLVDNIILCVGLIVNVVIRLNNVDVGIAILAIAQAHFVVAVEE